MSRNKRYLFRLTKNQSCCTSSIIRAPLPALLHACQLSRVIAKQVYKDIGLGGLFARDRDKLLVTASTLYNRSWCDRHHKERSDLAPCASHTHVTKWLGVKHIIYFAPTLLYRTTAARGRDFGKELQLICRPRVGGLLVEKIIVLTDEVVSEVRTAFEQGWAEKCWRETGVEFPEPLLEWSEDRAIFRQVKQLVDKVFMSQSRHCR